MDFKKAFSLQLLLFILVFTACRNRQGANKVSETPVSDDSTNKMAVVPSKLRSNKMRVLFLKELSEIKNIDALNRKLRDPLLEPAKLTSLEVVQTCFSFVQFSLYPEAIGLTDSDRATYLDAVLELYKKNKVSLGCDPFGMFKASLEIAVSPFFTDENHENFLNSLELALEVAMSSSQPSDKAQVEFFLSRLVAAGQPLNQGRTLSPDLGTLFKDQIFQWLLCKSDGNKARCKGLKAVKASDFIQIPRVLMATALLRLAQIDPKLAEKFTFFSTKSPLEKPDEPKYVKYFLEAALRDADLSREKLVADFLNLLESYTFSARSNRYSPSVFESLIDAAETLQVKSAQTDTEKFLRNSLLDSVYRGIASYGEYFRSKTQYSNSVARLGLVSFRRADSSLILLVLNFLKAHLTGLASSGIKSTYEMDGLKAEMETYFNRVSSQGDQNFASEIDYAYRAIWGLPLKN